MKNWKRALIVGMCTMLLSFSIMSSYQKGSEVQAVAVVDDILIVVAICAAFGIAVGIPTWQCDTWAGDGPIDDETADAFVDWWKGIGGKTGDEEMNDWMKKSGFMDENGELTDLWYQYMGQERPSSGGGDGGDDDDGSDLWKSIKKHFKDSSDKGTPVDLAVGGALGSVLGLASAKFLKDSEKGQYIADQAFDKFTDEMMQAIKEGGYRYRIYESIHKDKPVNRLYLSNQAKACVESYPKGSCPYISSWQCGDMRPSATEISLKIDIDAGTINRIYGSSSPGMVNTFITTNFPIYNDRTTYDNSPMFSLSNLPDEIAGYPSNINPDSVLQNTDAQNQSIPQTAPLYPSVNVPSINDFLEYVNNSNNAQSDEQKQTIIDNWIDKITNPGGSIDPDPDKPVDPDPDKPIDPDPDNPDKPEPNPDVSDGSGGTPDLVFPIKEIFPFCIPFDLIMAFKLFEAPAEAPVWKLPLKVPSIGLDYELVIDFNDFEHLAVVLRWIELVAFIIGMIMITRSHLIHG